jgi:hypothetical protein
VTVLDPAAAALVGAGEVGHHLLTVLEHGTVGRGTRSISGAVTSSTVSVRDTDASLPARSDAPTVRSWSPSAAVGTGAPSGTVPSQVASPEPPGSSVQQ